MSLITELSATDARTLLLSPEAYCNFDIPPYFNITALIQRAVSVIKPDDSHRSGIKVGSLDNVNYALLANKDGAYAWRPFQLVHPVLYVELVNLITEESNWTTIVSRFDEFSSNSNTRSVKIPQQPSEDSTDKESTINRWWHDLEQESIRLSLEHNYLAVADIADCYGSIYTHTVSWALHTRPTAKGNRNPLSKGGLLGNDIDNYLQDMHNRQTNGIPQGNMVSDLIAEMILGYADEELSKKIKADNISDYKILRYRDDYRIFTQSREDTETILLHLTNVLSELSLKLNSSKTGTTNDVIGGSLRTDKVEWILSDRSYRGIQHELIRIREFSRKHTNSGSLARMLSALRKRLENVSERPRQNEILIAIAVDIMLNNPRTYPTGASVIAKLLSFEDEETRLDIITKIRRKFDKVANIGNLDLWLQRINIKTNRDMQFDEQLCQLVSGNISEIWASDWLSRAAIQKLAQAKFIDEQIIAELDDVPSLTETESYIRNESPDMAVEDLK